MLVRFEEVSSTQDVAYKMAEEGAPDNAVVWAESQTEGRGRFQRKWVSSKREGLSFSIVIRPRESEELTLFVFMAALALARVIERETGLKPQIKWPNDLLLGERKVCGLLAETKQKEGKIEFLILGIGLNVNQKKFPEEIADLATSLFLEKRGIVSRDQILESFLQEWNSMRQEFLEKGKENLLKEFKERCVTLGKDVSVTVGNQKVEGRALDLDEQGALILELETGETKTILSGDVS